MLWCGKEIHAAVRAWKGRQHIVNWKRSRKAEAASRAGCRLKVLCRSAGRELHRGIHYK